MTDLVPFTKSSNIKYQINQNDLNSNYMFWSLDIEICLEFGAYNLEFLNAPMTIEENLGMADLQGKPRGFKWGVSKGRHADYRDMLKLMVLGLEDRLKQSVSLLSGGQRQSLTLIMVTLSMQATADG
jgi:ABC-type lipoprotein export system ATPase subunit